MLTVPEDDRMVFRVSNQKGRVGAWTRMASVACCKQVLNGLPPGSVHMEVPSVARAM